MFVAGADGCPGGWICVGVRGAGSMAQRVRASANGRGTTAASAQIPTTVILLLPKVLTSSRSPPNAFR